MAVPAERDDEGDVLAIIPGIALGTDDEDRHAFVQVISKSEGRSWDIRFPADSFKADRRTLDVTIGRNRFSRDRIELEIDADGLSLHGTVRHRGVQPYPVTLASPGIMGWYAYVPFMECFHGVVSTHHTLSGSLELNGRTIGLSEGSGYIEKDWGSSFPESWIWMQSNCFPTKDVSCMLSIAKIPFLGRVFPGFLGFVRTDDSLIRFGTYTGAKILSLESDDGHACVKIRNKGMTIEFAATLGPASHLAAPRQGKMDRTITESICGTLHLKVTGHGNTVRFEGTGTLAGIELSEAKELWVERSGT